MSRLCWFVLFLWVFSEVLVAQTTDSRSRVPEVVQKAMAYMQDNNYEQALKHWLQAQEEDPNNWLYTYQVAQCYYEQKDYKTAIKTLTKQTPTDKSAGQMANYYRLLAACQEARADTDNAIATLQDGIKLVPQEGLLYADLGGLFFQKGYNDQAVATWEEGIDQAPTHSTNYYWLTKMYAYSSEPFWALFYGELFINIEPNTQRSMEISRLLGEVYRQILHRKNTALLSTTGYNDWLLNDETAITSPCTVLESLAQTVAEQNALDFDSLKNIVVFRELLAKKALESPLLSNNALFLWQKSVQQAGYWEAYNYWLLRKSDPATFDRWLQFHRYDLGAFLNWIEVSHLRLNAINKLSRKSFYAVLFPSSISK